MIRKNKIGRLLCAALLLAATSAGSAWAAPSLVITGQGGNYELKGAGFEGIAAIDITLGYDTTTLSNPRVRQGGWVTGALFASNPNTPGVIRLGIATTTTITGSGTIATLSFDSVWGKSPQFTSLAGTLHTASGTMMTPVASIMTQDTSGSSLAASSVLQPQTTTDQQASASASSSTTSTPVTMGSSSVSSVSGQSTGSTVGTSVSMGSSSISGSGQFPAPAPESGAPTHPSHEPAQPGAGTSESVIESPPPATVKYTTGDVQAATGSSKEQQQPVRNIVYESIVSRFRTYSGPKTLQALTEIFSRQATAKFHQEPGIALSDGVTKVRVTLDRTPDLSAAPNFAIKGAKLVALTNDENGYYLEILPNAGVSEASVTVLAQGSTFDFPLVVAPLIDLKNEPNGKFDEASFALFLKEQGAKGDLNGDGRKDYLDEYIYTANYLVKSGKK